MALDAIEQERGVRALALCKDYVKTLSVIRRVFVMPYLDKLPPEALAEMADMFDYVKAKW